MEKIAEQIDQVQNELMAVMKQWDTTIQNPNANIQQIGFLSLRIEALCRELHKLTALEKQGKVA